MMQLLIAASFFVGITRTIQGLLINRTQPRFDTEEVQAASGADLSAELVRDYLALARATDRGLARISDDDELLRKTGVISSNNMPTLAVWYRLVPIHSNGFQISSFKLPRRLSQEIH